jgi:hypothetical protein
MKTETEKEKEFFYSGRKCETCPHRPQYPRPPVIKEYHIRIEECDEIHLIIDKEPECESKITQDLHTCCVCVCRVIGVDINVLEQF